MLKIVTIESNNGDTIKDIMRGLFELSKGVSVRSVEGSENRFKIGGHVKAVEKFIEDIEDNKKIKLLLVEDTKKSMSDAEFQEKIRKAMGVPEGW